MITDGRTGLMVSVRGLTSPPSNWQVSGVPFTCMMNVISDTAKPTILDKHVDLSGKAFARLRSSRERWLRVDDYYNPGPIQFFGSASSLITITVLEEQNDMMERLQKVFARLSEIKRVCRVGYSDDVLDAALLGLTSLSQILDKLARGRRH